MATLTAPAGHPAAGSSIEVFAYLVRNAGPTILVDTGMGDGNAFLDDLYRANTRSREHRTTQSKAGSRRKASLSVRLTVIAKLHAASHFSSRRVTRQAISRSRSKRHPASPSSGRRSPIPPPNSKRAAIRRKRMMASPTIITRRSADSNRSGPCGRREVFRRDQRDEMRRPARIDVRRGSRRVECCAAPIRPTTRERIHQRTLR